MLISGLPRPTESKVVTLAIDSASTIIPEWVSRALDFHYLSIVDFFGREEYWKMDHSPAIVQHRKELYEISKIVRPYRLHGYGMSFLFLFGWPICENSINRPGPRLISLLLPLLTNVVSPRRDQIRTDSWDIVRVNARRKSRCWLMVRLAHI